MSRDNAWDGRPWAARFVKFVAFFGPLIVAVLATVWISRQLPEPQSFGSAVGAWLVLGLIATVIVTVLSRLARRLLPFAALLKLSLAFPGEVPSRYKVARTRGGSRELQAEVDEAREHGLSDDRTDAALTVLRLVAALSSHDRATRGHAERVRVFVDMIADELDLTDGDVDRLRWAALLHDVGKIAVHPDVLNHPGRPSEDAWELLRTHPLEGARITAPLRPWLGHWALAIEQHHERWDGDGYPYGLSGDDLSLGARIVSVADAYDVMTAARAYKQPMPAHEAREELARHAGSQFDPDIVRAFLGIPLNRLRWAVGPFSWLVSTPFGRPFQSLSSGAGAVAAAIVAAVAGAVGYGLPVAAPADLPEIADVADEPTPAEPAVSPSPEPVESPSPSVELVIVGEEATVGPDGVLQINVLANDIAAGRDLRLVEVRASDGEVEWEPGGDITWTAPDGFFGTATIFYTVTDGISTEEGMLEITVPDPGGNGIPVVVDDTGVVTEDGVVVLDLLGDDRDPDGDALRIVRLGTPLQGVVVDNGDGTVTYSPVRDAVGGDRFSYTVSDGLATAVGQVAVTIIARDDAPRVLADRASVIEDGAVAVDVLANDVDVDGDALAVVAASVPNAATRIGADGQVTVTPDADVTGVLEGYTLVSDGRTAVRAPLVVEVLAVNDAPTIVAGAPRTADVGTPVAVTAWATGIAPGPSDESGQKLTVDVQVERPGMFTTMPRLDPATGTLTFRFANSATGSTAVTFVVRDDGGTARGGTDRTTVSTTLTARVAPPNAVDDSATTTQDQAVVIDLVANDSDPQGRSLTVVGIDDSTTSLGSVVDLGDGRVRFEPNPGATGTTSFTYTVSNGVVSDTATVTVTIQP